MSALERASEAGRASESSGAFDPGRILFETLRVEHGRPVRGAAHLARLAASARALGIPLDLLEARALLTGGPPGIWHARLTATPDGRLTLERWPHRPSPAGTVVAVGWANETIDSGDPARRHKTRDRAIYDRGARWAREAGWADALFLNEHDEVVEGAISTLVVETEGRRITPPLASGALPGVLRAALLRRGLVEEARITPERLASAQRVWLASSLRGLRRARLASPAPASIPRPR